MKITEEMTGAKFGDKRLSARLVTIAEQLAAEPDASFPVSAGGDAALEATYRFLNNDAVSPGQILAPHVEATVRRIAAAGAAIVAHDTTEVALPSEGADVGWLDARRSGFFAHAALAMSADGARRPFGVLGLRTIFRDRKRRDRSKRRRNRFAGDNEELRWAEMVKQVEASARVGVPLIHVMDREADSYRLLSQAVTNRWRVVIRMTADRVVSHSDGLKVSDIIKDGEVVIKREVALAPRRIPKGTEARKRHPPRDARVASLSVSAHPVVLPRTDWAGSDCLPTLDLNIVRVWERNPPAGAEPVEWRLITTEPIATADDVARVVDAYRARWVIEEYFKALKTGCGFERRQLENRRAIVNALAVFAPIAWQLLVLRALSRATPNAGAETVLTSLRLELLRKHPKLNLKSRATARDAMLAIAQLGGHIRNNGDPGWMVLWRGFEKLLLLEEGARLLSGCDQS